VTDRATLLSLLAQAVARGPAGHALTWRVCHAALDVFSVDGASITMDNSNAYRVTLCATDKRSDLLENLQDVLGEGRARMLSTWGTSLETLAHETVDTASRRVSRTRGRCQDRPSDQACQDRAVTLLDLDRQLVDLLGGMACLLVHTAYRLLRRPG
jgi:hypothetical protein